MGRTPRENLERAARVVSLIAGLVLLAGAAWKSVQWGHHVQAMEAYSVLAWIPSGVLAAGSLLVEFSVAALLLLPTTWRRLGLPVSAGFLVLTGVIVAAETMAGGTGLCGCLPFFERPIGWLSAVQNLAAALFLAGLWGVLGTLEVPRSDTPGSGPRPDAVSASGGDPTDT